MITITDYITGEIIQCSDMDEAIEIAENRCRKHNEEYCYKRGKHYSENAVYIVLATEIIIRRKL